jgi:hypothetical protein
LDDAWGPSSVLHEKLLASGGVQTFAERWITVDLQSKSLRGRMSYW